MSGEFINICTITRLRDCATEFFDVDTAYSDFLFLTGTYSDFVINGFVVISTMLKNKDAIAREDSGASFDECLAEQNKCQPIQDCGQIDPFFLVQALYLFPVFYAVPHGTHCCGARCLSYSSFSCGVLN
jgi:hypothetical protein